MTGVVTSGKKKLAAYKAHSTELYVVARWFKFKLNSIDFKTDVYRAKLQTSNFEWYFGQLVLYIERIEAGISRQS